MTTRTNNQEQFPTSEKAIETDSKTVVKSIAKNSCKDAIFCPKSDHCDGTHCTVEYSSR